MNNRLILNFSDNELDFAKKLIRKYRNKIRVLSSKNTYNKRDLVIVVMKNLVLDYTFFNNNAIIFFTGSYSRGLLNDQSDFDLNIAYKKGSGKKYKKFEELFYFIVCNIFDMDRKKVHPVFITFNNPYNTQKINTKLNDKDFFVILKSQNYKYKYHVKADSKRRMILQYFNNKNFSTLLNNSLNFFYSNQIEEWMFNFYFLNEDKYMRKKISSYTTQLLNDGSKLTSFKSQISHDIVNYKSHNLTDCKRVKEIKYRCQSKSLNIIYNYVLLLQLIKKNNKITMNFDNLNDKMYLKIEIKNYLNTLNKLYNLFNMHGIEYSLHNNDSIVIHDYNDICEHLSILEKMFSKILSKISATISELYN